jgi:hypothetical protein
MATRELLRLQAQSKPDDAPAHSLFDLVQVKQNNGYAPVRGLDDLKVVALSARPLKDHPRVGLECIVG